MWYNNLKPAAYAAARISCADALSRMGLRALNHAKPQQARFCWGRFAAEIFDLPGGIPLQLFDAHMHYSDTHGPAFDAVRERHGVGACTLACIPQMGVCSTVPDALYYKAVHPEGTVYVMGGLERSAWFLHEGDAAALGEDLVAQAGALLAAGCDGIKLLEGKPDIRRNFPIPDFDTPAWEPFWRWAEEQRVPILWHVNDPEEFWDASRINPYAKSEGWFYGPETINNEEQYRQVFAVLACHPGLRLQLAHLFFFSAQLPRLSALLRRYPEVRVDLTPGIELYTNLAGDIPAARAFFEEFGTRILYGSDIGSRASIAQPPRPLDSSESAARVDVIRTFLETPENEPYTLLPDGRYLFRIAPTPMRGLGLSSEALEQVYGGNARMFLGRARPVDAAKAASLAHSFAAGVEALHARELFLAADAAPLRQKAVQLQALAE